MAVTIIDLLNGAKFRSDQLGTDRVSDPDWITLANEAIVRAWTLAAAARQDFQVSSQDFTVVSGQTASIAVPATLFGLIDVVANPDTANEFSLGPFAWQNRKSPGGWAAPVFTAGGAQRARMMGSLIYLEPATRAGGTYRVWFCPKPTVVSQGDYAPVRVMTNTNDLSGLYTASGSGVGKTMTSTAPGTPLVIDQVPLGVGDRFINQDGTSHNDNGIYTVTQTGAAGLPWIATRATDFDSNSKIKFGQIVYISEGTNNRGLFANIAQFLSGVDQGVINFGITSTLTLSIDPILEPWAELLKVLMAIASLKRDERAPRDWYEDRDTLIQQMQMAFRQIRANAGPQKMIDTDARGASFWNGVGW